MTSTKRPLPQLAEKKTPPASVKEGVESDSGGRRHMSSSVPRTIFPPGPERAAMKKLKQKMTFSDHSVTSSAKSTPTKVTRKPVLTLTDPHRPKERKPLRSGTSTDPAKPRHKSYLSSPNQVATFVPVSYLNEEPGSNDERTSDIMSDYLYVSEGEMASSLTISSLLSKLDSVKNFLKEAEAMRVKFEDKKNEPGMIAQLNKLDKLIDQLQQQESGYLGELIRLTELGDDSKYVGEDASGSEDEGSDDDDDEEEEDSEGFSSDEDHHTMLETSDKRERNSGSAEGSSLSLRAQVELEKQAEQEFLALQKQKTMLTELLEKQKQIQELEAKQQALLEMKNKAEQQLKEAEAKGLKIQELAEAAEGKSGQPELDEREMLMSKLSELRARKERVDQITELLRTLRPEEDLKELTEGDEGAASPTGPLDVASQDAHVAESAQATTRGTSELVMEDKKSDSGAPPSMKELQMKLREAAEARKELLEARKLLAMESELEGRASGRSGANKESKLSWMLKVPRQKSKGVPKEGASLSKEGGVGNITLESIMTDLTDEEEPSTLERSIVSDYEAKLSRKREEVVQLLQEKEELKATHKRLLNLQKKIHIRQFLDDSSQHNTDHEAISQTDLTGATWGGSTAQSDPEDTATSISLPSEIAADITQESNLNTEPLLDHGTGATVEQVGHGKTPPFSVTRHTPRTRPNVRLRTQSVDSTEATLRADKKIKMDPNEKMKSKSRVKNPLAASFKPSFKSPPNKTKSASSTGGGRGGGGGGVFTPRVSLGANIFGTDGASVSQPSVSGVAKLEGTHSDRLLTEQTAILQNQLALTSHMCNQLLYGQNNLIRVVCDRLDRPEFHAGPQIEEHMSMLQQYQSELEAYYHQLCESYAQLQAEAGGEGVAESEEPVVPVNNDTVNEGFSSQPHASAGIQPNPMESFGVSADPNTAYPPHLSHFYPPLFAQPRPGPDEGVPPASPTAMSFLPPPPPPVGNPYTPPRTWHPQPFPPPPTGYPHHHSIYPSPFCNPLQMPSLGMEPSPGFQREERPSFVPQPTFGSSFMQPFNQGGYPYYQPTPAGYMRLGSFDGPGLPHFGAVPNLSGPRGGKEGEGLGLVSPSGVTGSSLQVHAPSSPPSDPSVSMQPTNNVTETQKNNESTVPASVLVTSSSGTVVEVAAASDKHVGGAGSRVKSGEVARKKETTSGGQGTGEEDKDGAESMSSLPMSVPEGGTSEGAVGGREGNLATGFSVFDALRDTIYSEVATLIANNENRPHFLVELFRELQMLSTDYLRQRALYNIQDLVTRYLTEEAVTSETNASIEKEYQAWLGEVSDNSESEGGSSVVRSKPVQLNGPGQGFDYAEAVNSASSVSTPPDEPFASSDLGDTVIRQERTRTHMKLTQPGEGGLKMPAMSPLKTDGSETPPRSDAMYPDIDTQVLDEQIKGIMMDVIPLLKENIEKECDSEMIILIGDRIVSMVVEQEKHQKQDFLGAFRKQLEVTIITTMEKYRGRKFRQCGEDLLMDVSEVLFNELAFFKMMEEFKGHPQLNGDYRSITSSQTTTEADDNSFAEGEEDSTLPAHPILPPRGDPKMMLDPALLQVLSFSANLTLQEEEDTLGKSRDDSLATSWDPKHRRQDQSSPSGDEQNSPLNVVELSVSESQPIQSVGSGEDDGERGTGHDELDSPLHHPILPPAPQPSTGGNQETNTEAAEHWTNESSGGDRDVTPPTPVPVVVTPPDGRTSSEPLLLANSTPTPEDRDEANVSIGKVSTISKEEGTEMGPLSPPGPVSSQPQITTTLTEDDLEARMKSEQRSVEGVGGVLSSLREQDQSRELGLVGDENEMDAPISSNGI